MARLLFLIAIVVVVYLLIRSFRGKAAPGQDSATPEDMVRCEHCGVHLPKGESVISGEHFFCSAEHRDAFLK